MELSFGWIFPVLCLAVMALCFLTFGRRVGWRGRFNRSCFGSRPRERKSGSPEELEREVAWLYRIATNLCHDRYRQLFRRPRTVPLESSVEDSSGATSPTFAAVGPPLDQLLEQEDMSACVQQYIEELPDSQRVVLLLHDLEGMTNPEIAEMLGCSVGAAKIRFHRARTKLKSVLENNCAFTTDRRGVFVCEPSASEPTRPSPSRSAKRRV